MKGPVVIAPKSYLRFWSGILFNTGIALVPPIMFYALSRGVTWRRLLDSFEYSWIYANCIGGLAFFAIPRIWMSARGSPQWLRWTMRVAVMFTCCVAGSLLAGLIFVALRWQPMSFYWTEFSHSLKLAAFLTFAAGLTMGLYGTLRSRLDQTTLQLRTKELERERALKLATQAQLASLESRIHPHFLFNALNSISSLIPEDPARAERLVEQMAALLRFSLDANQSGLVPLWREIKIVGDYLEIERARFGDRLRYKIDVPAALNESQVPPLSVQTLVENSIKHAIAPERSGGEIWIAAFRSGGAIHVEVSDCGPAFDLDCAPPGRGLDNLRGRLAALFGTEAAVKLEHLEGRNHLTLCLPEVANEHAGLSR